MKYKFIKDNGSIFPIEKMCNVLKLSSSGYYKWKNRPRSKRLLLKEKIKEQITSIYFLSKQRYGSPRITFELNSLGYRISQITVAKYMKELGLRSKLSKKFKVTTNFKAQLFGGRRRVEPEFHCREICASLGF
jgi:putative transposase